MSGTGSEVVVQSGFRGLISWILVPSLSASVAFAAFQFWRFGLPLFESALVLVGSSSLAVVLIELGFYLGFVREVRLYHDRVVFIKGFRQVVVSWRNLTLPTTPYGMGLGFTYAVEGERASQEWLWVSRAAGRAILQYPECPTRGVDPKVLRSVGL